MSGDIPRTYATKLASTDERQEAARDADELAAALHDGREKWSNLTLEQILVGYRRVIWPRLEAENRDPETTVPTRQWLSDIGHRNLEYALREYHDLTLARFCREYVGVDPTSDDWTWPVDHGDTLIALQDWETTQRDRLDGKETTVRTRRSRLATYCREYRDEHDTDDLLVPLQDPADRPVGTDMVIAVYDRLDDQLGTAASKEKYHRAIAGFYSLLVTRGDATYNPTDGLMDDLYNWRDATNDHDDVQPLTAAQIRRMHRAATASTDQLLILALCAWGLRRSEVAALHRHQFVLDPDDAPGPYITFDERKNAAGTVAVLYGADAIRTRLAALADDWTDHTAGYLFPSTSSRTGHIDDGTVYRRFRTLADAANVRLPDGDRPTPHNARKFWYDAYAGVMDDLDGLLDEVAGDQGSADVATLKGHYIEAGTLRELRRERMQEELAAAFEVST
jgi:integrase